LIRVDLVLNLKDQAKQHRLDLVVEEVVEVVEEAV
jgi:hypothetical protein